MKRSLRERLEALLQSERDGLEAADAVTIALLEKALSGDVRAYEVIRDTIGENPAQKLDASLGGGLEIRWKE